MLNTLKKFTKEEKAVLMETLEKYDRVNVCVDEIFDVDNEGTRYTKFLREISYTRHVGGENFLRDEREYCLERDSTIIEELVDVCSICGGKYQMGHICEPMVHRLRFTGVKEIEMLQ